MANNRLYLVHKPTMIGAYLGKRMGVGWYDGEVNLNPLYTYIEKVGNVMDQDDFMLLSEESDRNWDCVSLEPGVLQFSWVVE